MNRRDFLKGIAATAAGVLVPIQVSAEPERRIWALDRSMIAQGQPKLWMGDWFDCFQPYDTPLLDVIIRREKIRIEKAIISGDPVLVIPSYSWGELE